MSKNPVSPEETLIRIIFSPEHITDNGKLKSTFIQSSDLNNPDNGLSVERKSYVSRSYIEKNIQNYVSKIHGRKLYGFASIKCQHVLDIKDQNNIDAFYIEPRPTEDSSAHAVIICTNKYSRSIFNMVREKLINSFSITSTLEEALSFK